MKTRRLPLTLSFVTPLFMLAASVHAGALDGSWTIGLTAPAGAFATPSQICFSTADLWIDEDLVTLKIEREYNLLGAETALAVPRILNGTVEESGGEYTIVFPSQSNGDTRFTVNQDNGIMMGAYENPSGSRGFWMSGSSTPIADQASLAGNWAAIGMRRNDGVGIGLSEGNVDAAALPGFMAIDGNGNINITQLMTADDEQLTPSQAGSITAIDAPAPRFITFSTTPVGGQGLPRRWIGYVSDPVHWAIGAYVDDNSNEVPGANVTQGIWIAEFTAVPEPTLAAYLATSFSLLALRRKKHPTPGPAATSIFLV